MFTGNSILKPAALCILFLAIQARVWAQFIPFAHTYGGFDIETGYGVTEAPDSGYVTTGQSGSFSFGSSDMYLLKTDVNGQLLWQTHIGGFGVDGGRAVTRAHGGGFLVVGYTNSWGNGGYDYFVVRTNETGDTLWTRAYGGTDWDFAYSVCQTADGNYLVAGESYSFGNGGSDIWVLKLNDNGDTLSTFLWDRPGNQSGRSVMEYEPGKAAIAGYGNFSPSVDIDAVLLGWNHIGNVMDFETVTVKPGNQWVYACDSSTVGGFIGFGSEDANAGRKTMLINFYDGAGAYVGSPVLDEPAKNKELFCGVNFRNQGYYTAGIRGDSGSADAQVVYYKLGTGGYVDFGRVLGTSKYTSGQSILEAKDKGVVIAGLSECYGPGPSGALLWKMDSLGNNSGEPSVLLSNPEVEIGKDIQVFPNPFVDNITIHIPNQYRLARIQLIDLQGKLVQSDSYPSVSGQISWQGGQMPSGVYVLQLTLNDGRSVHRKVIKRP